MLDRMAGVAEQYSSTLAGFMRELTRSGKVLDAGELFATGDVVPKVVRARFFHETFGTTADQVPALCREIAALGAKAWVTTNYDNNLRHALEPYRVEVYGNDDAELATAQSFMDRTRVLVLIHGRAGLYDSIVVLQAEPDLRGESPDWLRERVDDEFGRISSVVAAAVDASQADEEEAVISDLAEQLVAPSAHRILDELVTRRGGSRRS
jgi:hypothetical protein